MAGSDGIKLFLRYSEGCRHYLDEKGLITDGDKKALGSGNPPYGVLKRVFYVAVPVLEKISKRKGKDVFDVEVLREFYSGEHNERKFREGEMACLALPARVLEKKGSEYLIELEPVSGRFRVQSDINASNGDWVLMHRINLVEKIPEGFAMQMMEKLRSLGLDKTYKFPKPAINYLKNLKAKYDKADPGAQDEGNGKAPEDKAGRQEDALEGEGKAYA